jgi:hypothetical protein
MPGDEGKPTSSAPEKGEVSAVPEPEDAGVRAWEKPLATLLGQLKYNDAGGPFLKFQPARPTG